MELSSMQRISVLAPDNTPLMPTKRTRAEKWAEQGKAEWVKTNLRIKAVRLLAEPAGRNTQSIVVGVDPGKLYSGIAFQSAKATWFQVHLELPSPKVRERMDNRRVLRRWSRSRRINRKVPFNKLNHREKRFDNRRQKKVPPSIKASRELEFRVVKELSKLFPIVAIGYEKVRADVDLTSQRKGARSPKGFSPVMVGQAYAMERRGQIAPVYTRHGYAKDGNGTSQLRNALGLIKSKEKSEQTPPTHAVDGIALACGYLVQYRPFQQGRNHGPTWKGQVNITSAPFVVIKRPPISRRQRHLIVPGKNGLRRKYGGTVTWHGFRKGDLVVAEMAAGRVSVGYVSSDTARHGSVSDFNWKRIGQFTASKVQLLDRATAAFWSLAPRDCSSAGHRTPPPNVPIPPSPAARGRGGIGGF
ncbi:RRXRR domain-containing protein [Geitlerinema sp. PCC 9228]|uniref:RRXRR domain-containing protein n=1 Tax=Geitlerinema sp. PCC 9228 TaxID=111611 RepID=UPI001FCCD183|nr:RRXRR domain-containing protein [Geitlerinema sp. PCC 9228]